MSSVEQNTRRIGFEACELLFQAMKVKPTIPRTLALSPVRVVQRKSTNVLAVPDRVAAAAIKLIRENAGQGISPSEIARRLHISVRTLERRFLKYCHRTPWKEITETRILAACELLIETNQTIQNIAHQVGFASVPHFNRIFEETVGLRPTIFRQKKHRP